MSDETWPNHPAVFSAAGVPMKRYPYFDAAKNTLDIDAMLNGLAEAKEGDVVLLHGCCHNPTGVDPDAGQWAKIADVCAQKNLLPLVDFAYQGLATGIEEDAVGLRTPCKQGARADHLRQLLQELRPVQRTCRLADHGPLLRQKQPRLCRARSRPASDATIPTHHRTAGRSSRRSCRTRVVTKQWHAELAEMRDRINGMRKLFVKTLADKGANRDFSFITKQNGMFSYSGLTKEQVSRLRADYGIYIVGSGRINVAGMTETNMDYLCEAIVIVL